MPSNARHVNQARATEELSKYRLDETQAEDRPWIATLLFDAALHWIDAYFATQSPPAGIHPKDHQRRFTWIASSPDFLPIERRYVDLFNQSMDARYELKAFTLADVARLRLMRLDPIRAHIQALLPP